VPEERFSWSWQAYQPGPDEDPALVPRTLVTFTLADTPDGGTLVTLVESGFDALPPERRDEAYRSNGGGWVEQLGRRLPAYLERAAAGA
jgi:uncharacterized protein YndB with AHSA1/START domain